MSAIFEMGFGVNDEETKTTSDKFKAKKGETYRVSFANWPLKDGSLDLSSPTPLFKSGKRLYHPNVGYFLDHGPEFQRLADGKPGKLQIATVIVVWPLDGEQEIDKEKVKQGKIQILTWVLSKDKYQELAGKHRKRHFGSHDLEIYCEDEKFQKMKFDTYNESALKGLLESTNPKNQKLISTIVSKIQNAAQNLDSQIARDMSLEDIKAKLSGEPSAPVANKSASASEVDDEMESFLAE